MAARLSGLQLCNKNFTYLVLCFACLACAACASTPTTAESPSFQKRYGEFDYCAVAATEQTGQYSCGPACLETVLSYWGKDVTEEHLLAAYPSAQEKRYYLLELKTMAEAEGLNAYALSLGDDPYQELEQQILRGRPLICTVRIPRQLFLMRGVPIVRQQYEALTWAIGTEKNHFVVVVGLHPQKQQVLMMDPAFGFVSVPWRRFERAWAKMDYASLLVAR